jgi:alcohol dehydrogenase
MVVRAHWSFHSAGKLVFGPGCRSQLGLLLMQRGLRRAFIVSDENLQRAGIIELVESVLKAANIEFQVYFGGRAEPEIQVADAAVAMGRDYQPDVVIGLGGGSNLDVAKFVAVTLTHGGQPSDYFGIEKVPGPIMPLVCLPTTSGTGSEVSHAAVLTDSIKQVKISCLSNFTRPMIALVDPEFTYQCPRQIMADSGIDALTHAIEGYLATDFDQLELPEGQISPYEGSFPLGDVLAEKAIRLIGQYLIPAVNDPEQRIARDQLSFAATLAGLTFSNAGVALVHAMEYPLGGILHCSHGAGNGLLLPFVMEFNLPTRVQKMARIADWLGVAKPGDSAEANAKAAIDAVHQMKQKIGIPMSIRDLGGREDQIPRFAQMAFEIKRLMWFNPRQPTLKQIESIYRAAF